MKIYVASSWRNSYQNLVVSILRSLGHEVYDFKNPPNGSGGFAWSDIDPNWEHWTTEAYKEALADPIAVKGFNSDFDGMKWADCCVMVLPCGRSANTEAGWMKGAGKKVYVFSPLVQEPELMYAIYDEIIVSSEELRKVFTKAEYRSEDLQIVEGFFDFIDKRGGHERSADSTKVLRENIQSYLSGFPAENGNTLNQ